MSAGRFHSTKLKIERANNHILDLETQFIALIETNPHRPCLETDDQSARAHLRILFPEEPSDAWSLIVGDAIHNLRAALDHMVWELVGRDGGKQDRDLKFPTGGERKAFEAACKRITTPNRRIIDVLMSLEAFPAGKGDPLYRIHQFDIVDKHRVINPVIRATSLSNLRLMHPDGAVALWIGQITFIGDAPAFTSIADGPAGLSLPSDNDTKATHDIFFGDHEIFPNQPIISTLRQLSEFTRDSVLRVETAIA